MNIGKRIDTDISDAIDFMVWKQIRLEANKTVHVLVRDILKDVWHRIYATLPNTNKIDV